MWATEQDLRKITVDILILIPRHPLLLDRHIWSSSYKNPQHVSRLSEPSGSLIPGASVLYLTMYQDLGLKNKVHDTGLATKKLKNQ